MARYQLFANGVHMVVLTDDELHKPGPALQDYLWPVRPEAVETCRRTLQELDAAKLREVDEAAPPRMLEKDQIQSLGEEIESAL
eukprot:COSAG04_NODE_30465_length_262_cov_0.957055_1_plen_83_part_10